MTTSNEAQRELAARVLSRRRLLEFIKRMNDRYMPGWVHEDICRRLENFSQAVAEGKSPRLMLLMPPRHGKSEIASRMFPAWHLGRHPDHEVIACSYNVSLALDFSKKVKGAIDDPLYRGVFPETMLDPNNQSSEVWGVANKRGGYVAAGIGGGITGRGAHVLLIDDPIKSDAEADSETVRESIWGWYGSTAYTRLAPGGGVLVIQTWWHDDDLAGRLQQAMHDDPEADQFEVIKYPAIAEHDEYLAPDGRIVAELPDEAQADPDLALQYRLLRSKGDALHPARYDLDKLKRIQKNIAKRHWSALYQQNPVPDDGAYFQKSQFRYGDLPFKRQCHVFMAWDFAISEKQHNDYTVGVVGLQDSNDVLHVAETIRFRSGDASFIVDSILNLAERWYHPSLLSGFEDGQIFRALEGLLKKRMKERRLYLSYEPLKPITDKMARARALQGRMQQGMVSFAQGAEWIDPVRSEMLRFPAGVHDDCVDALAWLAQLAVGREPPPPEKVRKLKSWKDKLKGADSGNVSHMAA